VRERIVVVKLEHGFPISPMARDGGVNDLEGGKARERPKEAKMWETDQEIEMIGLSADLVKVSRKINTASATTTMTSESEGMKTAKR
jgi:hypothetical protein